jgi:integrase
MRDHKSYPSTKQPEFIYLSKLAMDSIPSRSKKHIDNNPYAFYTRDKTHICEKTFDNAFNYAKKKLNLPPALAQKITPYCARHTFAALAKVRGKVDMHTLSKMMSHADTQMVERHYLQIEQQFDEEKRRAVDEIFSPKKE